MLLLCIRGSLGNIWGWGHFLLFLLKGTVLHSGEKVCTQTDLQLQTELS